MSEQPELIIDIGDFAKRGFYRSYDSTARSALGIFAHNDDVPCKFRLVRRSTSGSRPWDDVNIVGATIVFSIAPLDSLPTGGTAKWNYAGNLTAVYAFNASAATVEANLNTLANIIAAGGVTVEKNGFSYKITFNTNGARTAFAVYNNSLTPESVINISTSTPGDAGTREVQIISYRQRPYASQSAWSNYAAGAITVSEPQVGTSQKHSVQRIKFNIDPYEGSWIFNFPKPEITAVTARANTAAKERTSIQVNAADVAGSLNGFHGELQDNVGPVRWYLKASGSGVVAPATPTGGRVLQLPYTTGASAVKIASEMQTAFAADVKFAPTTVNGTYVIVNDANVGERLGGFDITSGFPVARLIAGNNGALNNLGFKVYDADGSVGIWFNSGATGVIPAFALACRRAIAVPLVIGDSENAVATAIDTTVSADAKLDASAAGNVATITDRTGGERVLATAETSGMGITQMQAGKVITADIGWNWSFDKIQKAVGDYFEVTKVGKHSLEFRATKVGVQPAITVDATGLSFPNGITGRLNLSTTQTYLAFESAGVDEIEAYFEGKLTLPGYGPYTFARERVRLFRSIIGEAIVDPEIILYPRALVATSAWNPPSIANGNYESITFAVPGAKKGDPATGGFDGGFTPGIHIDAWTDGDDSCTVSILNKSGGAVDLDAGTVTVFVFQVT